MLEVNEHDRFDETFIEAAGEQPYVFTAAGMITHVITHAAGRTMLISSALAPAGAAELDDDPLSWFAQQAPPRAQPPRRWQNKKDTRQPRQPDQRRTGQPSAEHSDLGASMRSASQLITRTESAMG